MGCLTMEEILGFKLDADWVVLSACNTGTGAGAGAEAASGPRPRVLLCRHARVLVTNWSVHSQSARELVTDLFKRQADGCQAAAQQALRPGDDGAGGWPRLSQRRGQNRIRLCPSAVLGAVHHHRRWRRSVIIMQGTRGLTRDQRKS